MRRSLASLCLLLAANLLAGPAPARAHILEPAGFGPAVGANGATDAQPIHVAPADDDGTIASIEEAAAAEIRTLGQLAREYVWQGMLHIWKGWRHLAFVLCLCLLTSGRRLFWLITAFTVAHSISLLLSFFGIVSVSVVLVEIFIALSIAFMAREAIIAGKIPRIDSHMARYLTIVAAFGLLHGLGFATWLKALGVVAEERIGALLFFHLGIEMGQLVFVAAVTAAMMVLKPLSLARPVRLAALCGVGAAGCFWVIERVAQFVTA